jgi:hypothetical protein
MAAVGRIGCEDVLGTVRRIVAACSVEFSFETIQQRRIDRPVPDHNIGSQHESALDPLGEWRKRAASRRKRFLAVFGQQD